MTKTFRDLQESLGHAAPFFLYGGVCLFGLVFIFIFLPETRGKTPEETAQSFVGLQPLLDRVRPFPFIVRLFVSKMANHTGYQYCICLKCPQISRFTANTYRSNQYCLMFQICNMYDMHKLPPGPHVFVLSNIVSSFKYVICMTNYNHNYNYNHV